jgi:preprotein translocase subunit YajC
MTNLLFFYLQAAPAGAGYSQFILIGAMILVFWLFLLRPQAKKAKEQQNFSNSIEKGTKVVTIAGIHGVIHKVNEDGTTMQLEVSPGNYLKIEKSTISLEWTKKINETPGLKK